MNWYNQACIWNGVFHSCHLIADFNSILCQDVGSFESRAVRRMRKKKTDDWHCYNMICAPEWLVISAGDLNVFNTGMGDFIIVIYFSSKLCNILRFYFNNKKIAAKYITTVWNLNAICCVSFAFVSFIRFYILSLFAATFTTNKRRPRRNQHFHDNRCCFTINLRAFQI